MKKMYFVLISVIVSIFLFISCGLTNKSDSAISDLIITKSDEQGENERDEKKSPEENSSDNITVSVSIDYELNSWDGDILVRLTLSEGAWDNFFLWPDGGNMSNTVMAAEKAAISKWIDLTFSSSGISYSPVLLFVGGGYDYLDIRTSPLDNSLNRISINPKVLTFRFRHGYSHIGLAISEAQIAENFSRHFPITVTLNQEKLTEMKEKTDITGNLTIGSKSAVLDKLRQ